MARVRRVPPLQSNIYNILALTEHSHCITHVGDIVGVVGKEAGEHCADVARRFGCIFSSSGAWR